MIGYETLMATSQIFSESLVDLCQYNEKTEEKVAVIWRDPRLPSSDVVVTFQDILCFSHKIVNLLTYFKVSTQFIALRMEQCISFPSIIHGILKYGTAFLCLDTREQSSNWNKNICDTLNVQWMFVKKSSTHDHIIASETFLGNTIYLVKTGSKAENEVRCEKNVNIAYACQTSGTTGTPKIVQVPHASIIPNIIHLRSKFRIESEDIILQAAPSTFDPSVVEMFLALSSGASLLMVPHIVRQSPTLLAQVFLSSPSPTVVQATPSLISSLNSSFIKSVLLANNSTLRVLAFGGEPCPRLSVLSNWKSDRNCTLLFNLYGVTEVSCWSTCHEIKLSGDNAQLIDPQNDQSPLGTPFPFTKLEVRNKEGNSITEGTGKLFISNGDRMCIVEGQLKDADGIRWCATGDFVNKTADGNIYYIGRGSDARSVKRWGHKVCLDLLERTALECSIVQSCRAVSNVTNLLQLVLFVVLSESENPSTIQTIKIHLRKHLLSVAQPDAIIPIPTLPVTHHGKIDFLELKSVAAHWEKTLTTKILENKTKVNDMKDIVKSVWLSTLLLREPYLVDDKTSFLANGGDSALAALMAAELLRMTGVADVEESLLTTILSGSFKDVLNKLIDLVKSAEIIQPKTSNSFEPHKKRCLYDVGLNVEIKAFCTHIWKEAIFKKEHPNLVFALSKGKSNSENVCYGKEKAEFIDSFNVELLWKCEMSKCVDASPLVLQYSDGSSFCIIGSHSGKVVCVNVKNGEENWSQQFSDRIECSASVTQCGCYDGRLYCIELFSGQCCWAFQTDAMIKSSPVFTESTLIFGSYDQKVYCLNLKDGSCMWQQCLQAGAVLASPCLANNGTVLIATLGGATAALRVLTGDVVWKTAGSKPYFASPSVINEYCAIFGDVSGLITCINILNGQNMWSYQAKSNLFSSFAVHKNEACECKIVFGCTDGHTYCLNEMGSEVWNTYLDDRVTSTPFIFDYSSESKILNGHLVAVTTFPGTLVLLTCASGKIIAHHNMAGETFSSPVVVNGNVILGNRDNFVYCFRLSSCAPFASTSSSSSLYT